MNLDGKKILFIAPAFFGYEIKIADKMVALGAKVDFYDERSITKSYEKALLKINPQIFRKKTGRMGTVCESSHQCSGIGGVG